MILGLVFFLKNECHQAPIQVRHTWAPHPVISMCSGQSGEPGLGSGSTGGV
jgi:hypothetical protein